MKNAEPIAELVLEKINKMNQEILQLQGKLTVVKVFAESTNDDRTCVSIKDYVELINLHLKSLNFHLDRNAVFNVLYEDLEIIEYDSPTSYKVINDFEITDGSMFNVYVVDHTLHPKVHTKIHLTQEGVDSLTNYIVKRAFIQLNGHNNQKSLDEIMDAINMFKLDLHPYK